jgi:hypothetical protein
VDAYCNEQRREEAPMPYDPKKPEDVLRVIKGDKIKRIELRFTDLSGRWEKIEVRSSALDLKNIESGIGFGNSSMSGTWERQKDDLLMVPDPSSAFLDPFVEVPTLGMICNVGLRSSATERTRSDHPPMVDAPARGGGSHFPPPHGDPVRLSPRAAAKLLAAD